MSATQLRGAMRLREAASYLAVSQRTLWQWAHDGVIPCVRAGTGKRPVLLFLIAELQAWLTRQVGQTREEAHP